MTTWREEAEKLFGQKRQEGEQQKLEEKERLLREQERERERREAAIKVWEALEVGKKLTEIGKETGKGCSVHCSYPWSIQIEAPVRYYYVPASVNHNDDFRDACVKRYESRFIKVSLEWDNVFDVVSVSIEVCGRRHDLPYIFAIDEYLKEQFDGGLVTGYLAFLEELYHGECSNQEIVQAVLSGKLKREDLPPEFELPPDVLSEVLSREAKERAEAERAAKTALKANSGCLLSLFGF